MFMLYYLDLIGTLAFAITGAFRAREAKPAFFGVIFLGIATAVGGGTLRDLIIGRAPLFYLTDPNYLLVAIFGSIGVFLIPSFFKKAFSFFRLVDSIGLASFAIIGVSVAYGEIFADSLPNITSFLSCVLLGMTTAIIGGVIRDAVMGGIPLAFKAESNYASSAFLGAASFYSLMFYNIILASAVSIVITLFMREVVSSRGIYRRIFKHEF